MFSHSEWMFQTILQNVLYFQKAFFPWKPAEEIVSILINENTINIHVSANNIIIVIDTKNPLGLYCVFAKDYTQEQNGSYHYGVLSKFSIFNLNKLLFTNL